MTTWTRRWPTERGWYWFYGTAYKGARRKLTTCECFASGPVWYYMVDGQLMYEDEGSGLFQPIPEPESPAGAEALTRLPE